MYRTKQHSTIELVKVVDKSPKSSSYVLLVIIRSFFREKSLEMLEQFKIAQHVYFKKEHCETDVLSLNKTDNKSQEAFQLSY